MLSKPVAMWAQAFLYRDLGLDIKPITESEDKILADYDSYFIKPLAKLAYKDENHEMTDSDLMSIMSQLKGTKICSLYHLLKPISEQTVDGADFNERLQNGYNELKKKFVEVYAIVKDGNEFITLADAKGNLAGIYPTENIVILGEKQKFKRALNFRSMIKKDPLTLTDFCIDAIRNAVNGGVVDVSELTSVNYVIPTANGFEDYMVTAVTPELPSYFTRSLIDQLPPAYIMEYESPYHAALDYASTHDNYSKAHKELSRIIAEYNTRNHTHYTKATNELTPDIAIKYLADYYNTDEELIRRTVSVPTFEKQYDMYEYLHEKYPDKSFPELRDLLPEDHQGVYLEDLVLASLREYSLDENMTVMDYINFCRSDEDIIEVPNIRDWVARYIKEFNVNPKQTLAGFINNETFIDIDDKEADAVDFVSRCPNIDDKRKVEIIDAMTGNGTFTDLCTELITLGVPGHIVSGVQTAKETGSTFVDKTTEINSDVVTDYLTQHGIPRVLANQLSEGNQESLKTNIGKDDISSYLNNLGFSKDDVDSIVAGYIPAAPVNEDGVYGYLLSKSIPDDIASQIAAGQLPSSKPTMDQIVEYLISTGITEDDARNVASGNITNQVQEDNKLNEPGYLIAESILHDLRNAVKQNDSDELRDGMYGVVVGYLRIMMLRKGDEQDALDFLNNLMSYKKDDPKFGMSALNDITRPFIASAIAKLEKYIEETK